MTNHVPTLETCQKLKAAGFLQETQHCWVDMGEHWIVAHHPAWTKGDISAPLLTEILDNLPFGKTVWQGDENYFVSLSDGYGSHDQTVEHNNPAEAAALLYLALKEQS